MLGRHRPRLPPPRPGRRDRGRRVPRVGARHPGHARTPRTDLRGHRPARPDQDRARGAGAGAADRPADAEPATRRTSSPRPSRSPSTSGNLVPGIDVTNDPLLQAPAVLLPRHPAHPARRARTSPRSRSTGRTRRSTTCCATACTRRRARRRRAVPAELARRRLPVPAGDDERRLRRRAAAVVAGAEGARAARRRSTTTSARPALFWLSMTPVEQDHIVAGLHLRAGQVLRAGRSRSAQLQALANIDPELCAQVAAGLGLPAPRADGAAGRRRRRARRCRSSAARGRPTAGWSASSRTRPAT